MSMQRTLLSVFIGTSVLLAGCDTRVEAPPRAVTLQVIRSDPTHNRLWVLERDGLSLHDAGNGRRLRRFELPEWTYAGFPWACAPDLVLDSAGVAYVSSNIQPVLWKIDPRAGEVRRIALRLDADNDKEIGFTALTFAADGSLNATAATVSSRWRIDVGAASAAKVADDPSHWCQRLAMKRE